MLRFCVSWRVPRLSFLPITVIGRFVFLLRGTVLVIRYRSNDSDRRGDGGFLEVGEWKSWRRHVSAMSYRHGPKNADVERRGAVRRRRGEVYGSVQTGQGQFGFFLPTG
jgi:hypothetical protein